MIVVVDHKAVNISEWLYRTGTLNFVDQLVIESSADESCHVPTEQATEKSCFLQ